MSRDPKETTPEPDTRGPAERLLAGTETGNAHVRALLASLPSGEPSGAAKARVRRALARGPAPRRAPLPRFIPIVALVLLASTAAVASAGLGGLSKLRLALVSGGDETSTPREHEASKVLGPGLPSPAPSVVPAAPGSTVAPAVAPEPSADEPRGAAPAELAAPSARPAPPPRAAPLAPPVSAPSAPAAVPSAPAVASAPAEVSQGAALVLEAMRALRKEHDPARAAQRLAEYRAHHGGGALDEEALALAIEASVATGDGDAKKLAASYVARYPRGRYAKSAEAVLAKD